jgi:DNA repair protein RecO (recombination protein O)
MLSRIRLREDFDGEIIIAGLIANTNVKITDVSGNLVYETTSQGSQASWNGKNFSGQRVHTGVYLIFCATTRWFADITSPNCFLFTDPCCIRPAALFFTRLPYNDSFRHRAHVYTEKVRAAILLAERRPFTKDPRSDQIHFSHLFLLEMEVYHQPDELQKVKEARNFPVYTTIPFDINKTSLAIFISEVLSKSLKEEEANPALYEFLFNSLLTLDLQKDKVSNFHIYFLLKLTRYLGFSPNDNYSETKCFFDYLAGMFAESPPLHNQYFDKNISTHVHFFLASNYEGCMIYPLNSELRVLILSKLIDYYNFHFEKTGKILSLNILKEVYHF